MVLATDYCTDDMISLVIHGEYLNWFNMLLQLPETQALQSLTHDGRLLFSTRSIRLFAFGLVSVILVLYLTQLGFSESEVGVLLSLTLAGDAAISLCNSTSGLSSELGAQLLAILGPAPVAPWAPTPVDPDVLALTGSWFWGPSHLLLRVTPIGLDLAPATDSGRGSRFLAADSGWRGLDGYYTDELLQVVRRADGTVSHLDLASFVLTRTPYDPTADVPGGVDPDGWR